MAAPAGQGEGGAAQRGEEALRVGAEEEGGRGAEGPRRRSEPHRRVDGGLDWPTYLNFRFEGTCLSVTCLNLSEFSFC